MISNEFCCGGEWRVEEVFRGSWSGIQSTKKDLAKKLELDTVCTCGTLALEAHKKGARIGEVPIQTKKIDKPRKIAWKHFLQFYHVIRHLIS